MRRIVLTGGPGAGKTAVQQVAVHAFPGRIINVPEAATILFSGGFPRLQDPTSRAAAQRAIYHVQRELEALHEGVANGCALLCDRGTVDGLAYWQGSEDFFDAVGSTRDAELSRYEAVIQLGVPTDAQGYDRKNPTRIETSHEAKQIGDRIRQAWEGHPRFISIDSAPSFWAKVQEAVEQIGRALES